MDAWSTAVSNVSEVISLEDEIVQLLEEASQPLSSAQLLLLSKACPDRETMSRTIFTMVKSGRILKGEDVPAPPGTPRATVGTYLPNRCFKPEQESAPPPSVDTSKWPKVGSKLRPAVEYIAANPGATNEALAPVIDVRQCVVSTYLSPLISSGVLHVVKTGGRTNSYYIGPKPATVATEIGNQSDPKVASTSAESPASEDPPAKLPDAPAAVADPVSPSPAADVPKVSTAAAIKRRDHMYVAVDSDGVLVLDLPRLSEPIVFTAREHHLLRRFMMNNSGTISPEGAK